MFKKLPKVGLVLLSGTVLAACGNTADQGATEDTIEQTEETASTEETQTETSQEESTEEESGDYSDHDNMNHKREDELPTEIPQASDPMFAVGETAIIEGAHMDIMEGVEAEVTGAYDTTLYTVTFETTDGMMMEDHKWVVTEEMESDTGSFEVGDTVTLTADHMEGMEGQEAEITGKEEGPAYAVSFEPSDGSEPFVNHRWVAENELSKTEDANQ